MAPAVDIDIDPDSSTAPFDQLRLQIIEQVRSGQLIAGTKIPTVRALAVEVGLAPNTVAKAYRELGEQGVIETRGKQGTFIASGGDPIRARAEKAATGYVQELRKLGVSDEEILGFVQSALRGAE
ncbi:GntR family transcriptional regulator [Rhodococcus opacus]|uniref:GntR family transcriptional regulator n=1 Tax=Rhodococcus opacus TaxID=37919 RepID=A0AAX3YJ18_RHOOP|nr:MULTISPECIES: GntR family transcriptional regulator [Rhodococcus]ELB93497.1 GntR family transcriptional regulator [Rhodococcus wratislaviensis IFP 2016]MCZ4582133.1 GntR family transcriptional regulator [Rhodococcus opacus]MDI9933855.1 GntR family transcriptional regulator [Rhodococcus sp. IEGM 1351]MDX5963186.1 GntR family transcriptional regulator [Rhodococcus opacus]QZS54892.1 GntR family transcriptional regulator [Rhodococcus opacus]